MLWVVLMRVCTCQCNANWQSITVIYMINYHAKAILGAFKNYILLILLACAWFSVSGSNCFLSHSISWYSILAAWTLKGLHYVLVEHKRTLLHTLPDQDRTFTYTCTYPILVSDECWGLIYFYFRDKVPQTVAPFQLPGTKYFSFCHLTKFSNHWSSMLSSSLNYLFVLCAATNLWMSQLLPRTCFQKDSEVILRCACINYMVKFLPGVLLLHNVPCKAHLTVVKSGTCHLYINNNMSVKKINSHTYYSPLENYKGNRYKLLAYWFLGSIGSGETFIVIG